jgi:hypothetical protein
MSLAAFAQSVTSPALREIVLRWGAARGVNILPPWEQLNLQDVSVSLVWVYRYHAASGRFTGRLAGDRITKALGKNLRGLPLDDAHSARDYLWVHRYLARVVTQGLGYRSAGKLFKQAGRFIEGERIALPLAGDGVNADGVLGASDYRHPHLEGPFEILTENEVWETLG